MRELNQALILNLVRQAGPISRAEIAKRLNLSRSTVSNIVNELVDAGRVFEVEKGESRGGRRPILLELNYRSRCVIGVEIATTFLNLIVTDLNAAILYHHREVYDIGSGPRATIARVQRLVAAALNALGLDATQVAGVGIGVPGPLEHGTGQTIAPPIMPGWGGFGLRSEFAAALPFPVLVDNDANLGALAEHQWGAARGFRNVAYIYLNTGVGAGLVLNGAIYRGEIGSAGEIGHVTIDEKGPPCACGSSGCLEAVASTPHMLRQVRERSGEELTLEQLIARATAGDPLARELFVASGTHLGVAVASLLNLFNPGLVVLGGPLAAAGDLLLETVRTVAYRRALSITLGRSNIVAGSLGQHAVALGAASQIIHTIFSPASLDTLVGQL